MDAYEHKLYYDIQTKKFHFSIKSCGDAALMRRQLTGTDIPKATAQEWKGVDLRKQDKHVTGGTHGVQEWSIVIDGWMNKELLRSPLIVSQFRINGCQ